MISGKLNYNNFFLHKIKFRREESVKSRGITIPLGARPEDRSELI